MATKPRTATKKELINVDINIDTPKDTLTTRKSLMNLFCERKIDRNDLNALLYSLQGASSEHQNMINLTKIQLETERIKIQERDVIVREETKLKLENKIDQLETVIEEMERETVR
jgi:hypothetical protein